MKAKSLVCPSAAARVSGRARSLPFCNHTRKAISGISPVFMNLHEAAVRSCSQFSPLCSSSFPRPRPRTRLDLTPARLSARGVVTHKPLCTKTDSLNSITNENVPTSESLLSGLISSFAFTTRIRGSAGAEAVSKLPAAAGITDLSSPASHTQDRGIMKRAYITYCGPPQTLRSIFTFCRENSRPPYQKARPAPGLPSPLSRIKASYRTRSRSSLLSTELFPATSRARNSRKSISRRYERLPSPSYKDNTNHGCPSSPATNAVPLPSSGVIPALTKTYARFQQQLTRCLTYVEARGKMTAAQTMTDPVDILNFFVANADASTALLSTCLRRIASTAPEGKLKEIIKDERFQQLVRLLEARVDDCDARMLTQLCQALYSFRNHTEAIAELGRRVSTVIVRRENAFSPKNIASLVFAFSWLRLDDALALHEFLLAEAMKLLAEMEPTEVVTLLEGFRRMRVGSKETTNVLLEKLTDDVDRFTSKDVVALLRAMASAGTARGFLLRRVATLAFDNLESFQPRQLASILCSLTRLRFASIQNCDQLYSLLRPSLETLPAAALYETLEALTLVSFPQVAAVSECIEHMWRAADKDNMALTYAVAVVYAILQFQLHDKTEMAKQLLLAICQRSPPEGKECLNVRGSDRRELERLEGSGLHNEVMLLLDSLRGKYQLQIQRNHQAGPYWMEFLDEETKICLDIDSVYSPTTRALKFRSISSNASSEAEKG